MCLKSSHSLLCGKTIYISCNGGGFQIHRNSQINMSQYSYVWYYARKFETDEHSIDRSIDEILTVDAWSCGCTPDQPTYVWSAVCKLVLGMARAFTTSTGMHARTALHVCIQLWNLSSRTLLLRYITFRFSSFSPPFSTSSPWFFARAFFKLRINVIFYKL